MTHDERAERWTASPFTVGIYDTKYSDINDDGSPPRPISRTTKEWDLTASDGTIVAFGYGNLGKLFPPAEQVEANAHLFKASPLLYRELSRAVGWLEFFSEVMPGSMAVLASIEDARAALAAARGER